MPPTEFVALLTFVVALVVAEYLLLALYFRRSDRKDRERDE